MKLYYSNTSPYSRKVRLVIRLKGLESQIDEILVNPFGENTANKTALIVANPLGKIPTLVLNDKTSLFDSPVICHYLDKISDNKQLIPVGSKQRFNVLRWEAMTDGLTDATYNIAIERKRPASEQSSNWIDRWSSEIKRTLLYIENSLDEINTSDTKKVTLAHLALASAISYLELRFPEALYKADKPQNPIAPNTSAWYETFKNLPAMQATQLIDIQN